MIEINLLPGPRKKKSGSGFSLPDFKELASSIKDPLLIGAVGAWVVGGAIFAMLYTIDTRQQTTLRPQLTQLQNESRNYTTLIAQKQDMEALRDSLIRELEAIREIDADRYIWPHIMQEIAAALPQFTWIITLDNITTSAPVGPNGQPTGSPPVRFGIDGRTADLQAYTRFVSQLERSPWLTNVQMGPTATVLENDRPVRSFRVEGTFATADSAFITTAPVTEAIR